MCAGLPAIIASAARRPVAINAIAAVMRRAVLGVSRVARRRRRAGQLLSRGWAGTGRAGAASALARAADALAGTQIEERRVEFDSRRVALDSRRVALRLELHASSERRVALLLALLLPRPRERLVAM